VIQMWCKWDTRTVVGDAKISLLCLKIHKIRFGSSSNHLKWQYCTLHVTKFFELQVKIWDDKCISVSDTLIVIVSQTQFWLLFEAREALRYVRYSQIIRMSKGHHKNVFFKTYVLSGCCRHSRWLEDEPYKTFCILNIIDLSLRLNNYA